MQAQKIPRQIRLDLDALEALDPYRASFVDFPPSGVAVVHRALQEWLAEKRAVALVGSALPAAIETAGHEAAPVSTDAAAPASTPRVHVGLDLEGTLEDLPPAQPAALPAILPHLTRTDCHLSRHHRTRSGPAPRSHHAAGKALYGKGERQERRQHRGLSTTQERGKTSI